MRLGSLLLALLAPAATAAASDLRAAELQPSAGIVTRPWRLGVNVEVAGVPGAGLQPGIGGALTVWRQWGPGFARVSASEVHTSFSAVSPLHVSQDTLSLSAGGGLQSEMGPFQLRYGLAAELSWIRQLPSRPDDAALKQIFGVSEPIRRDWAPGVEATVTGSMPLTDHLRAFAELSAGVQWAPAWSGGTGSWVTGHLGAGLAWDF